MTSIKDNKFLVALGGITLLGVILLLFLGFRSGSRYDLAKEEFELAASEASSFENLKLYPRQENRDGKSKALEDYKKATESLQQAFEPYRPKELTNVSPQAFTDQLKKVNDELLTAFNDAGTKVPEDFFSGFERYRTSLARGETTGMLNYQLEAVRFIMKALAQSGASELKNLYRPQIPEEEGRPWEPQPNQVARPLPLEITFVAPEKAVRQFLSSITKPEPYFTVIRSLRITNTKKDPPRASDAKFEKAQPSAPAEAAVFDGGFVLPPADGEEAAPAQPAEAAAPAPAPARADSSRILAQVLGMEEVQVFIRLDVMQFLPAKPLP
jgi:hypothetical protein